MCQSHNKLLILDKSLKDDDQIVVVEIKNFEAVYQRVDEEMSWNPDDWQPKSVVNMEKPWGWFQLEI